MNTHYRIWSTVLSLCIVVAGSVLMFTTAGCNEPIVIADFTIAGKRFQIVLDLLGPFRARAGAEPVRQAVAVPLLDKTPTDTPASADLILDAGSILAESLDTAVDQIDEDEITGTATVGVRIASSETEDPCDDGTFVGSFELSIADGVVTVVNPTLALPPAALAEAITGSFTMCLTVSATTDLELTITEMEIEFGPDVSDGACASAGERCSAGSDCCAGLVCGLDGLCVFESIDNCIDAGGTCDDDGECCGPLTCSDGTCQEQGPDVELDACLEGGVFDESGDPLPDAVVESEGGGSVLTDEVGHFCLPTRAPVARIRIPTIGITDWHDVDTVAGSSCTAGDCQWLAFAPGWDSLARECGDGVVDAGEECDPPDDAWCDADCQIIPGCGNSVVDAGEECDPPDGDTCDDDCQLGADDCMAEGGACTTAEDCCEGLVCGADRTCQEEVTCAELGGSCAVDTDCCGDLICGAGGACEEPETCASFGVSCAEDAECCSEDCHEDGFCDATCQECTRGTTSTYGTWAGWCDGECVEGNTSGTGPAEGTCDFWAWKPSECVEAGLP